MKTEKPVLNYPITEKIPDFVGELELKYQRTSLPVVKITTIKEAIDYSKPLFSDFMDDHEEFKIIHLNTAGFVNNIDHHSIGFSNQVMVSLKDIFAKILILKTKSIIVVHNHPSGNTKPSRHDEKIAQRLDEACKLLDIYLLDFLIVTRESYFSFKEECLL